MVEASLVHVHGHVYHRLAVAGADGHVQPGCWPLLRSCCKW
jgi:hypothetical protein